MSVSEVVSGFDGLGLSEATLKAIASVGFEEPTPVQAASIPVLLRGADLMAQAQTGTGKTAAFALPLLERLDADSRQTQALVVCPTRELAVQVAGAIQSLGRSRGLRVLAIYGGQSFGPQFVGLNKGAHVVVGSPGRLLDHIRRGTLKLGEVRTVILDEADEMLAMGFIEDIELILQEMPEERQVGLFSATIPAPIARLSQRYLRNPEHVKIAADERNTPQIRQCYCEVNASHKPEALVRLLEIETPGPTIIFVRTKRDADELGELLRTRGLPADSLHGDLGQAERDRVMKRFREGRAGILVATDVAARGLDIEGVTHVINFDIPWDVESYTHRIGRTGRAGREGDAITLVTARERRQIKHIENVTGARILRRNVPTAIEIAIRRRELFKQSVAARIGDESLAEFRRLAEELAEGSDPLDAAAAALSLLWEREAGPGALLVGPDTVAEREIEPQRPDRPSRREREERDEPRRSTRHSGQPVRLFVEAGRQHGLRPGDLVGAIANEAGVPGECIGNIEIHDRHCFVDVPEEDVERVVGALMKTTLRGRRPRVELFDPKRARKEAPERGPRGRKGLVRGKKS